MNPDISVVIATKDRAEYLDHALASLGRQTGAPPFEAIVVDNGSTDATAQIVERARKNQPFPVMYAFEERPNRGAARNRGIAAARGRAVLFCDDDVYLPPTFVSAHAAAHAAGETAVVSGPIINVPSYHERPKPTPANYSNAFFCTCNVSVPKSAVEAAGGFDPQFNLYGWEDTDLGIRLRERGVRRRFAWDAYLWHIKPPHEDTLEVQLRKAVEKAAMAARFVRKYPSTRVRSATGAHRLNLLRGKVIAPLLPLCAGIAQDERFSPAMRGIVRAALMDGVYTRELARALDGR